jgi:regulator of sigma E protease
MQTLLSYLDFLRTPLAFLFVLGVLVFVHEFGHFIVARLHGVRVLTFSLGFGPKILKFRRGDTEYCVSAVPLGGYVKLAGETAEDALSGAPDEFLSKPKWVRFQVYLAGPVMNLMLAVIVLAGVLSRGADVPIYTDSAPVIGHVAPNSPAERAGLTAGDRIVSVAGSATPTWDALDLALLPKARRELAIVVERNGQRVDLLVTPDAVGKYELGQVGILPVMRPEVQLVTPGAPAERAGLQRGDIVLAVDGQRDLSRDEIIGRIQKSRDTALTFTVERTGGPVDLTITPKGGIVGVVLAPFEIRRVDPTLAQAFSMSVHQNWESTKMIGATLKGLITRETPMRQLMGPVAIAELSGQAADLGFLRLFELMAMISLNLGLLNLMPVPVLDGGHIAILAVEGLSRRDLSMRVKERILIAGAALIALLMVTVIFNDISRLMR